MSGVAANGGKVRLWFLTTANAIPEMGIVTYDDESQRIIDELAYHGDCYLVNAQLSDDRLVVDIAAAGNSGASYSVFDRDTIVGKALGASSGGELTTQEFNEPVFDAGGRLSYAAGPAAWSSACTTQGSCSPQTRALIGDYVGGQTHPMTFQDLIVQWVGDRLLTLDRGTLNLRDVNGAATALVQSGVQTAKSDGHDLVWLESGDGGTNHLASSPYSTDPSQIVRHAVRDVSSSSLSAVGCGFAALDLTDGTDLVRLTDGAHWHVGYSGLSVAIGHCESGGDLWIVGNSGPNVWTVTKIGIAGLGAPQ